MAVSKSKKAEIVQELGDKLARSAAVVFAENKGLTVNEFQILRRKLRAAGAEAKVAKKTLVKVAARANKMPEISDDILTGPAFVAFSYQDQVAAAKVIQNFSKDNEKIVLLGGIMDGALLSKAAVQELATLPSREELLAKFIGLVQSPLSSFAGLFSGTMSKFARATSEYAKSKPA